MAKPRSRKPGSCHKKDFERHFISRTFLRPSIMLLLAEEPSHGYALLDKLVAMGVAEKRLPLPVVYRVLRDLEWEDLAASDQVVQEGRGPARRVYRLTNGGWEDLASWSEHLKGVREYIGEFQDRYESTERGRKI